MTKAGHRLLPAACVAFVSLALLVPAARLAAAEPAPATMPASGSDASIDARLPHVHINRAQRLVDLDATVTTREAKWLELLACSPKTREYESVLSTSARPSHIHLALLLLGLEPGATMSWSREGDKVQVNPPRGPKVAITLVYQMDGKEVEVAPGKWIINQKTNQPLADNIWLFAGSKMIEQGDQKAYLADLNGSAIALVNFGDDVLTRPGTMTNSDDDSTWGADTKNIPPVGTEIRVRLRPVAEPATQPAAKGEKK